MALIARTTYEDVKRIGEEIMLGLRTAGSLEAAAQSFVTRLVRRFPSVALARVFGTVRLNRLPPDESAAAATAGGGIGLLPSTEVLTLLGTAGARPEWNDRHRSREHLAIPLVSRAHVDEIPMVARLLADLRYKLNDDANASAFVTRAFANANGLFFVPDAATTRDEKGRNIVPATDFIRENEIRSVFGFGGSYVIQPMFVATILFTRERFTKSAAMNFLQLSSAFKAGTSRFVSRGLLFAGEDAARSNG
jgi:hypothetical protein